MTDNRKEIGSPELMVIVEDSGLSTFAGLHNLPSVKLDVSNLDHFAQHLKGEIARRVAVLSANHSDGGGEDVRGDDLVADEWLLVECEAPACNASTAVDAAADDPARDEPPLRTVLAARGWSLDGEGRDLCPHHGLGVGGIEIGQGVNE